MNDQIDAEKARRLEMNVQLQAANEKREDAERKVKKYFNFSYTAVDNQKSALRTSNYTFLNSKI